MPYISHFIIEIVPYNLSEVSCNCLNIPKKALYCPWCGESFQTIEDIVLDLIQIFKIKFSVQENTLKTSERVAWNSFEHDMKRLSYGYKKNLFVLIRFGDDPNHITKHYFFNGKEVFSCKGKVIFPLDNFEGVKNDTIQTK